MSERTYIAEWVEPTDPDEDIKLRPYGNNLPAAQAFARHKSGEPAKPGPTVYVIASEDGRQIGQWAYHAGFTYGFEGA